MKFFVVWCLTYTLSIVLAKPSASPFVVLPPSLRINAVNTIIVAPIKGKYENVDIHITIVGYKDSKSSGIFTQKLRAKRAGAPHSISFELTSPIEKAKITVNVQGHTKFETELRAKPNLAALHIHTDKPIYSSGETVHVRALPLTYEGAVYDGILEFALVNPDGFELVRKRNQTKDGYIPLAFELPKHLFYGDWRILARPQGSNDEDLTFDAIFQVKDYVLPPFKIIMSISEGQSLDSTNIAVEARYYYGAPLSGSMTVHCSTQRRRYDSAKPTQLLQSQVRLVRFYYLPTTWHHFLF
ncbi:alpha-2-macroglobulin family protein [Ancylostoma caninum]|uniref:Alpha-2-macroglobulin family protein n=1 Tax=Ancylostoma caninum TaxID=29170 RepID=A0A368FC88_ANCCA|nr:alpha-2-macroglobulin family protein [Ancylostoma caninum]